MVHKLIRMEDRFIKKVFSKSDGGVKSIRHSAPRHAFSRISKMKGNHHVFGGLKKFKAGY